MWLPGRAFGLAVVSSCRAELDALALRSNYFFPAGTLQKELQGQEALVAAASACSCLPCCFVITFQGVGCSPDVDSNMHQCVYLLQWRNTVCA